jgi:glycosyltransferase involved in cell wall biosynthesis
MPRAGTRQVLLSRDPLHKNTKAENKVTILLLISSEGYYGVENMLVTLARQLSLQGCRCVIGVFCNSHSPHTEVGERAQRQGLTVEIVTCDGKWDWAAVAEIRKLLVKHNVDILHAHGYKADLYACAAGWSNRVKLMATSHNWTGKTLSMRAYAVVDRLALGRFEEVIVVSDAVGATLRRWGVAASKVSTIPNGVDLERFRGAAPVLRNEIAAEGQALVGFVGRLVSDKGGMLLIRAARQVLAIYPKTKFVLVGEGAARQEWETLSTQLGISEYVSFAGMREDMPGVYESLDIVVLPSLVEALPMCLLEAMAAGKPVIATRVGAVPKLVNSEETGLLLDPGDVDGLAGAILRLLRDPELASRLGENGRAHVARHYSAEAMGRSYIGKYQQMLGRHRDAVRRQASWEAN